MRPELFALGLIVVLAILTACAACKSEPSGETDTATATTTTTGCDEPVYDAEAPATWSFCGCSDESPWYAHCGEGFFCEQAVKYTSVPPEILGGTCSPLCRTDRDCEAHPFEGYEVECGGHHCEILCNAATCPADMVCQGNNCVHAPGA
ncbi:hypothetical protein OV203_46595 [Nannocystis sp. ILAH1]|uniref:hypothetical protein n=1 Tax=Nannocystis sp. ILAH1 TaxID=2996789 RepID=UPI0022722430|nr:hypothetical protein [Nannocystis sp. ILAH1]MCY0994684.1 hypothetical protein [Nannocystis sp. ILAH1]